jgi:transcriptional regulator with XRE-family HTH domain
VDSPLKTIRRTRTMTQTQLADLVGIPQDQISRAERGRIRLRADVERRIAAVLGVSREELFPEQQEAMIP